MRGRSAKCRDDGAQDGVRVLVVEGRAKRASAIRRALEAAPVDFVVSPARRLWSALQILAGISIDAVLLDLDLPDSEGLEALYELRDEAPAVPVLIVGTSQDGAEHAIEQGADDWLTDNDLDPNILGHRILEAIKARPEVSDGYEEVSDQAASPPSASIVLVQDDPWVRRLLSRNLERTGHRVEVFGAPQQALSWSHGCERVLDLLVCDTHPPGMDACRLREHLRQHSSDLQTLLLGAHQPEETTELEDITFLRRPYSLEDFEGTVDRLVSRKQHSFSTLRCEESC